MIVNEPIGAAEYDGKQPFGLPYHGLVYSGGDLHTELGLVIKYQYQADYSDGGWLASQKSIPPSQFFDLHLPVTDTPPDLVVEYKYKYRNTAQINNGELKRRALNGAIYHSPTTGNWIVRIDGVADLLENTAEITVDFIPFGVLGTDDRLAFSQSIVLDDIGQAPLRQNLFPSIKMVNATPAAAFPSYKAFLVEDSSCIDCKKPKIRPFYASRTGRRISIGIPAPPLGATPPFPVGYSDVNHFPHAQVFLAWLLAEVEDDPSDRHPTIKISLLYDNKTTLGFAETRHEGDYFYQEKDAGYPFVGGVSQYNRAPNLPQPCSSPGESFEWVDWYGEGYAPSSDVAAKHMLEDYRHYFDIEIGFINRILAVWFNDDESINPLKITQYSSFDQKAIVEDDYVYSVDLNKKAVCDGRYGLWAFSSLKSGTSTGSYGYHHSYVYIRRAAISLGDRIIRSYGQTDVFDYTVKIQANPDYSFDYVNTGANPVTTFEPDGPLYTAGTSLLFQFNLSRLFPTIFDSNRQDFSLSAVSSVGTLMPCISLSSNHGFFCFFDLTAGAPKTVVMANGKIIDLTADGYPWLAPVNFKYNLSSYIIGAIDLAECGFTPSFGGSYPAAYDWI